jgi:hypothetical protein
MLRLILLASVGLVVEGCPRSAQDPEPGDAPPCMTLSDCNEGRVCGGEPLYACVDGLCEMEPSLVLPCRARE